MLVTDEDLVADAGDWIQVISHRETLVVGRNETRRMNMETCIPIWYAVNSLAPARCIKFLKILSDKFCQRMFSFSPKLHREMDANNRESTLIYVMAWWRQATSYYLNRYWHKCMSIYVVSGSQRIKNHPQEKQGLLKFEKSIPGIQRRLQHNGQMYRKICYWPGPVF